MRWWLCAVLLAGPAWGQSSSAARYRITLHGRGEMPREKFRGPKVEPGQVALRVGVMAQRQEGEGLPEDVVVPSTAWLLDLEQPTKKWARLTVRDVRAERTDPQRDAVLRSSLAVLPGQSLDLKLGTRQQIVPVQESSADLWASFATQAWASLEDAVKLAALPIPGGKLGEGAQWRVLQDAVVDDVLLVQTANCELGRDVEMAWRVTCDIRIHEVGEDDPLAVGKTVASWRVGSGLPDAMEATLSFEGEMDGVSREGEVHVVNAWLEQHVSWVRSR